MAPLKLGWKSKEVYLNNQLITPQSSKDNELAYIHHLMTSVPSNYKDEEDITLMIHDTPQHFNSVVGMLDGANTVNHGYNKRYVPTSFDFKVVLTRLEKTKMMMGVEAECALHEIRITDLKLCAPMLKPSAQLSAAINELMIQKNEEVRFYRTGYRYVAKPIQVNTRHIQHKDLFNGARPGRLITKVVPQTVYNGAHTLNPNLISFPTFDYLAVSINKSIIPPVYRNSQDVYMALQQNLDRRYSEMPFSHADCVTSYGIIVNDLIANKDGFDQVLPNSTSGNFGIELHFTANTTVAQQLICVGEFRNQLSIGYGTQARLKYNF
ncbi:Hypothetical predicted protein [Paramuricea clavata]|uniref:Uncharacterized protein n=1 Tax=Paramuricea clavata TaxID=317549 RepID=A0A7D9EBP8_PARCT|nr:Hypothetical predicted protein [Paramuricea clavata]